MITKPPVVRGIKRPSEGCALEMVRMPKEPQDFSRTIEMWKKLRPTIPSGKPTKNYGKSPFLMGKSTISMAIFNSFLYVYQRVVRISSWAKPPARHDRDVIIRLELRSWSLPSHVPMFHQGFGGLPPFSAPNPIFLLYPLVNLQKTMENHHL